jgi:hypothetical protein
MGGYRPIVEAEFRDDFHPLASAGCGIYITGQEDLCQDTQYGVQAQTLYLRQRYVIQETINLPSGATVRRTTTRINEFNRWTCAPTNSLTTTYQQGSPADMDGVWAICYGTIDTTTSTHVDGHSEIVGGTGYTAWTATHTLDLESPYTFAQFQSDCAALYNALTAAQLRDIYTGQAGSDAIARIVYYDDSGAIHIDADWVLNFTECPRIFSDEINPPWANAAYRNLSVCNGPNCWCYRFAWTGLKTVHRVRFGEFSPCHKWNLHRFSYSACTGAAAEISVNPLNLNSDGYMLFDCDAEQQGYHID